MGFTLSDEHIDFITNDIKSRGIKIESLQQSLLDHICCILEAEVKEEKDFEQKYEDVLKRFFKEELSEIEEETEQLIKNRYYYQMKKFLYILFFLSVIFNLYFIGRFAYDYFSFKREMSEATIIPSISLKDATPFLLERIKEEYPDKVIGKKIYVGFLTNQFELSIQMDSSSAEWDDISVDSVRKKRKLRWDAVYKQTDSLAAKYPSVTFVIAFSRTAKDVDDCIAEYRKKTKHLLFLKGMQKLYSGFKNTVSNNKPMEGFIAPDFFLITKEGELIYHPIKIFTSPLDKAFIDSLSD